MMRIILILTLAIAACTPRRPIPVEVAMAECTERARAAIKPSGSVGIGVNSSGKVSTGLSIGLSSDFLTGRDPNEVYATCVVKKSGVQPTKPLTL